MSVKRNISAFIGSFISIVLLSIAFWIIHVKLKQYHYHEIVFAMHSISKIHILWALGLTFVSYFVMTFYDYLALRYVNFKLSYSKISFSSFIAYSFSNSMGHPLITGAVRYRLYSAWGLSAINIAKVVAFCTFTLWLGFVFLAGLFFSIAPMHLPSSIHLPFNSIRIIGFLFLSIVIGYFGLVFLKRIKIPFRKWSFELPRPQIAISQLFVSSLDWIFAGSVLFLLLPQGHSIHFFTFMSFYLLAQVIAIISQVPGGIGVFESLMLLLLGNAFTPATTMGVLLANRMIYYLIPLGFGSLLFAGNELVRQRKHLKYVMNLYDKLIAPLAPQLYAILVFLGGIILLFSTVTPSVHHRLMALQEIIPVPVIEISHFMGSIIGITLLFLARGLQKRLDSAYYLTILMMLAGVLVSLLKGFDYEEALILSVMLLVLIPSHRHFYRKSSLLNQPFTPMWILSIFIALCCTVWLGFFSFKHVQYAKELWWSFTLHGDAPRFLRELVGLAGFLLIFSIIRMMRITSPKIDETPDMNAVKEILKSSDNTNSNLALLGDKRFFFNEQKTAFIMYAIEGRSWIVMGDPIGEESEIKELAWQFREYCDRNGGRTVFYEVGTKNLDHFLDMGLTLTKIGETARIDLSLFDLEAAGHKRHRRTLKTVELDGCSFEMVPVDKVSDIMQDLQTISDAWLVAKNAREKGFSLGYFSSDYIRQFPVAVVKKNEEIIAFANIWTTNTKNEMSIDLMRYIPGKTDSVMEYLFLKLIIWGKENGYLWFELGMAPLSGLYNRSLAPLWHRLGSLIFQFGNPVYKLQGLRAYKEKFDPTWEPIYIASPGGLSLPEILINLSSLISKGYKRYLKT